MMARGEEIPAFTEQQVVRGRIAFWVVVVVCLVFVGAGVYVIRAEEAPARNAIPIQAKIEHSELITQRDARGRSVEQPLVIYSYGVHGVQYTTSRVGSLAVGHRSQWAPDVVHRYRTGETVTAYYEPLDPGSAFLVRVRDWRLYAITALPATVALVLIVTGVWDWWRRRRAG